MVQGGTTHTSFGRRSWRRRGLRDGLLPPTGCRDRSGDLVPRLKSRRRRNREGFEKKASVLRVFRMKAKYRRKERSGGGPRAWGALVVWPGGALPSPWWVPSGASSCLRVSSRIKEFLEFFWNFLSIFNFHLFLQCIDKRDRHWHWALN